MFVTDGETIISNWLAKASSSKVRYWFEIRSSDQNEIVFIVLLFSILFFLALVLGIFLTAASILAPLDKAARNRRAKIRFTMVDFFGLMFLIQLPMALTRAMTTTHDGTTEQGTQMTLYVLGWFASAVVWGKSVAVFSQAGITDVKERAWLVFFVLPVAFMGIFATIPVGVGIAVRYSERQFDGLFFGLCVVETLLVVGVYFARYISRRIAGKALARTGNQSRWEQVEL